MISTEPHHGSSDNLLMIDICLPNRFPLSSDSLLYQLFARMLMLHRRSGTWPSTSGKLECQPHHSQRLLNQHPGRCAKLRFMPSTRSTQACPNPGSSESSRLSNHFVSVSWQIDETTCGSRHHERTILSCFGYTSLLIRRGYHSYSCRSHRSSLLRAGSRNQWVDVIDS